MIEPLLKVWSVCVGEKYSNDYVYRLQTMVANNLAKRYQFLCLTDREIPGVDCVRPLLGFPGWYSKLELFELETGPAIYFDLDVVIVGPIEPLLCVDGIKIPKNWAQSGHGGCQSSVMAWKGDYAMLARLFKPELLTPPTSGNFGLYGPLKLWGDQEYITEMLGEPGGIVVEEMNGVFSYKYHCQNGLPPTAKVVCFHGSPKPHEVSAEWIPY